MPSVTSGSDNITFVGATEAQKAERADLFNDVQSYYYSIKRWRTRWAVLHSGALYLGVALSGSSALVVGIKRPVFGIWDYGTVALFLSGIATIVGTIAATGSFEKSWSAMARAYTAIQLLYLDAKSAAVSNDDIRSRLKVLIADLDAAQYSHARAPVVRRGRVAGEEV